jgi:hypothetical protein
MAVSSRLDDLDQSISPDPGNVHFSPLSDQSIPPDSGAFQAPLPGEDVTQHITMGHLLRLARVVGYGLLLMSFIDFLYVLIPADFMDPVWEYQFASDLVKLVPVPLLALVLAFWGDYVERHDVEWPILRFLSWLSLLFSITLFLLMPLTVANTLRIHQFNNEQINTQVNQQQQQIDAARTQLEQATPQQLQSLASRNQNNSNAAASPDDARAQILDNLQQTKEETTAQADQARANVKQNLIKNSLKLVAESCLGSFLFLYAWLVSRWARRGKGTLKAHSRDQSNPATVFGRWVGRMMGRKPKRMKHRIR